MDSRKSAVSYIVAFMNKKRDDMPPYRGPADPRRYSPDPTFYGDLVVNDHIKESDDSEVSEDGAPPTPPRLASSLASSEDGDAAEKEITDGDEGRSIDDQPFITEELSQQPVVETHEYTEDDVVLFVRKNFTEGHEHTYHLNGCEEHIEWLLHVLTEEHTTKRYRIICFDDFLFDTFLFLEGEEGESEEKIEKQELMQKLICALQEIVKDNNHALLFIGDNALYEQHKAFFNQNNIPFISHFSSQSIEDNRDARGENSPPPSDFYRSPIPRHRPKRRRESMFDMGSSKEDTLRRAWDEIEMARAQLERERSNLAEDYVEVDRIFEEAKERAEAAENNHAQAEANRLAADKAAQTKLDKYQLMLIEEIAILREHEKVLDKNTKILSETEEAIAKNKLLIIEEKAILRKEQEAVSIQEGDFSASIRSLREMDYTDLVAKFKEIDIALKDDESKKIEFHSRVGTITGKLRMIKEKEITKEKADVEISLLHEALNGLKKFGDTLPGHPAWRPIQVALGMLALISAGLLITTCIATLAPTPFLMTTTVLIAKDTLGWSVPALLAAMEVAGLTGTILPIGLLVMLRQRDGLCAKVHKVADCGLKLNV
ncbi:MAG TPA: hypothetical protein VNC84_02490 [Gammaproteobacteria bacterium]|jgi:hypothetical protein|nr:hypothetical protein [Gammaproteobacteria bacterium]